MLTAPEPLTAQHALGGFDRGTPSLDDWLRKRALKNPQRGASRSFVVCESGQVVGYYALAASAVAPDASPGRFRRNMPDPVPVVVLARLAVARAWQGRGLGRGLFQDAALRVVRAAGVIGSRGLLVHALSDEARDFYLHLGLRPSPLDPMTLMVTVASLKAALGDAPR